MSALVDGQDEAAAPAVGRRLLAALGVALGGLVTALVCLVGAAGPATASSNAPGVWGWETQHWYAYVEAGESLDVSFVLAGAPHPEQSLTFSVTDPAGNVAWTCAIPSGQPVGTVCATTGAPSTAAGVWRIDTEAVDPLANAGTVRYEWTIDVVGSGGPVPGRVWSPAYRVQQDPDVSGNADTRYWAVNDAGFVYDLAFRGFNGFGSTTRADAVGNVLTDGSCDSAYVSQDRLGRPVPGTCGEYRLFFEPPAADLPVSAPSSDGPLTVLPPPLLGSELEVTDLAFTRDPGTASGRFTYTIPTRFAGNYELQVDVDGNGSFTDPVDRRIAASVPGTASGNAVELDFDGLDGLGAPIGACDELSARIYFEKLGEIHVVQEDVEGRAGGISMTLLNGPGLPGGSASTIYWDDTNLSTADRANVTPVLDGTGGVDSAAGVHGWNFDTNSWGNERFIDDWAFAPVDQVAAQLVVPGLCTAVEKTSTATSDTRPGDVVTYTVRLTNTGESDFTAADPAELVDDLSGVLDDAEYNGDASSDLPGTVAFVSPELRWSGALAAGQSVVLTYSVTVTGAGDGAVLNSVCTVPLDGSVADCAQVETLLPRLAVTKTADVAGVRVGDRVTYTVTASNTGPGEFTAAAPASFTDGMSDVLDDATFDQASLTASVGTAAFTAPDLGWTGELAAGASATVTYAVTYTCAGDGVLRNTVCAPVVDAADPADPCARVDVPGVPEVPDVSTPDLGDPGDPTRPLGPVVHTGGAIVDRDPVGAGVLLGAGVLALTAAAAVARVRRRGEP